MLRVQRHGGGEVFHPPLLRLAGQAVDQIQRQILELGFSGGLHRLLHLLHGMDAADGLQFLVAGGLHPQRDAVEACPPQSPEGFPVPGGIGVGLKGDLRVPFHLIALFNGFQDPAQPFFSQIAGGAAAEINRVHGVGCGKGRGFGQVGAEGVGIGVHAVLRAGQRVKIAVNAFGFAERDMDIQPQRAADFHDVSSRKN